MTSVYLTTASICDDMWVLNGVMHLACNPFSFFNGFCWQSEKNSKTWFWTVHCAGLKLQIEWQLQLCQLEIHIGNSLCVQATELQGLMYLQCNFFWRWTFVNFMRRGVSIHTFGMFYRICADLDGECLDRRIHCFPMLKDLKVSVWVDKLTGCLRRLSKEPIPIFWRHGPLRLRISSLCCARGLSSVGVFLWTCRCTRQEKWS